MTNDAERELIRSAKSAIKRGKFQQLTRDVNKIHKNQKKAKVAFAQTLDTLLGVLKKYPLHDGETETVESSRAPTDVATPEIVISESYSAP